MLCVIVPRPDRRSLYNKLFFSVEQLQAAAAKVAAAQAERARKAGEPAPPPPEPAPPRPTGLENFAAPPRVPAHLYDFVFVHEKLVLTHAVASGATVGFTGHGTAAAAAAEADANKTVAAVEMQGAAARAFGDGATADATAEAGAAPDDGLRLLLEGVNAFSTDPDVDQRATAELRARLDAYAPPSQRARRDAQTFDSAEHLFEVHVAEGEHARAELDAQLNHTGAVVSKLVGLHDADASVLRELYEHDLLAGNETLAAAVSRDHAKREREAAGKAAERAKAADAAAKGAGAGGVRQPAPIKSIADPRAHKGSAGRTPHASAASSRKVGF